MWIEATAANGKIVFINFDNVTHVTPAREGRWFVRFVHKEISNLTISATEAQMRGWLSSRK